MELVCAKEVLFSKDRKVDRIKGEVLEMIILDMLEMNWCTDNFWTVRASKYDDFQYGADIVCVKIVESREGKPIPIAIVLDVTTSIIGFPLKIKRDQKYGGVSSLKYFEFEDGASNVKVKTGIKNVPHVIAHIHNGTLEEIVSLWKGSKGKEVGVNMHIAKHLIQFIIIKQIIMQLEFHIRPENIKMNPNAKRISKMYLDYFRNMYYQKLKELGISEDEVRQNITIQNLSKLLTKTKNK
jgi:hypothetical protein